MLKALDGKRTVRALEELFPNLDHHDIALWLEELLRTRLISVADIPFVLPPAPSAKRAAAPAAAPAFDPADVAASLANWATLNTETLAQIPKADLNKTVQMATLRSSQAMDVLAGAGFVGNMIDPIPMAGSAAPQGRHRVEKLPPAAIKSAVVFDTDAEDTVLLPQLLKDAGYVTRLAVTRQSLVALLNAAEQPDVVFLKLGAPDIDVFKVLEKLRSHPRLGSCAVVMMAAKPSREDIAKSILLGASGWIVKPYTAELVAAAIRGVLTMPAPGATTPG
jgi:two-component system chemotaxis response regulator CheY